MNYFVTITLKPRYYTQTPEQQFDILKNELVRELAYNKEQQTIVFELTKAFNIHCHAILWLRKNRELHDVFRANKVIGFIKVEQPKNYEQCMEYIFKNVSDTYNTLRCRHPVIKNDTMYEYRLHPAMPQIQNKSEKDVILGLRIEKLQLHEEITGLRKLINILI